MVVKGDLLRDEIEEVVRVADYFWLRPDQALHMHPDYRSPHHAHWMGTVRENFGCADPLLVLDRFERALKCLKQHFGRRY